MVDIEFKVVRSGVRPHRVAILVPQTGGPQEWLQVIDVCSQIWGGGYSVVVPTDGDSIAELFWQLLDKYDPDIILLWKSLNISNNLAKEIPQRLNPFPGIGGGQTYHFTPIWPGNIPYPLTRVSDVLERTNVQGVSTPVIKATPIVEVLAYSHLGHLPDQTIEEIKANEIAAGYPDFDLVRNPGRCGDLWNLAWEKREAWGLDEWGKLPRDLARLNLGAYSPPGTPWHESPVVLVIGETTADFCLFYSLSHMRPHVYWLPTSLVEVLRDLQKFSLQDISARTVFYLAHQIQESILEENRDGRPLFVTSVSQDADHIKAAVEQLERAGLVKSGKSLLGTYVIEHSITELLRFRYVAWELNNSLGTISHSVPVVGGKSVGYLEVRSKHLRWRTGRQPVWVSEIAVDRYHLPRRAVFNSAALTFDALAQDTRVTSSGIAFNGIKQMILGGTDLDVALARPRLRVMNPHEVMGLLAARAGYEIEVSEKGSYQDGTVNKFGGIEEFVREYHSPRWRVLSKFLDGSNNQPGVYDQGMKVRDRRYLDAAAIAKVLGCEPGNAAVNSTIDSYLKMGVFQRGFALKCGNCRQMDWYAIGDVGDRFKCSRCSTLQHYGPEQPWMYRLDELVFQCLRNHLDAHILALSAIGKWADRGAFMWIPSFNVCSKDNRTRPYAEIDIACTVDGQIVIGECKTADSLSSTDKAQLAKYENLAKAVGADIIAVCTSAEKWSKAATAYFKTWRQHLASVQIDLRVLEGSGLGPG